MWKRVRSTCTNSIWEKVDRKQVDTKKSQSHYFWKRCRSVSTCLFLRKMKCRCRTTCPYPAVQKVGLHDTFLPPPRLSQQFFWCLRRHSPVSLFCVMEDLHTKFQLTVLTSFRVIALIRFPFVLMIIANPSKL